MLHQICQVHNFSHSFFLSFSFLLSFSPLVSPFFPPPSYTYIPLSKFHEIDSSRTFLPHVQNESSQNASEASTLGSKKSVHFLMLNISKISRRLFCKFGMVSPKYTIHRSNIKPIRCWAEIFSLYGNT